VHPEIVMRTIAALALIGLASPALAQTSFQLSFGIAGDAERRVVSYDCTPAEGEPTVMQVEYINAAPNFLAIVPGPEGSMIFATVISGSGARYAAGQYIWWTKGSDADLYDATLGEDAPPISHCSERIQTP
jgi:membrane-bound inhibitor of C-type lysozyme